ncbi:hypothetical protein D9M68_702380 [compost metagenome]
MPLPIVPAPITATQLTARGSHSSSSTRLPDRRSAKNRWRRANASVDRRRRWNTSRSEASARSMGMVAALSTASMAAPT